MSTPSPALHFSGPFQKSWLGTQDRDLPGWVCPPSLVQNVPKATPVLVTAQPSCSALCREDEEEPNLIYSFCIFLPNESEHRPLSAFVLLGCLHPLSLGVCSIFTPLMALGLKPASAAEKKPLPCWDRSFPILCYRKPHIYFILFISNSSINPELGPWSHQSHAKPPKATQAGWDCGMGPE